MWHKCDKLYANMPKKAWYGKDSQCMIIANCPAVRKGLSVYDHCQLSCLQERTLNVWSLPLSCLQERTLNVWSLPTCPIIFRLIMAIYNKQSTWETITKSWESIILLPTKGLCLPWMPFNVALSMLRCKYSIFISKLVVLVLVLDRGLPA